MFLNDTTINKKLFKINKFLKETYGFKVKKTDNIVQLNKALDQISSNIFEMKRKGVSQNDALYNKNILMLEATKLMIQDRESKKEQMSESHFKAPYKKVLGHLCDHCTKNMEIGDSIDDAVREAMKVYNSSKYRFPSDMVENDLIMKLEASVFEEECMYEDENAEGDLMSQVYDMFVKVYGDKHPGQVLDYLETLPADKLQDNLDALNHKYAKMNPTELEEDDDYSHEQRELELYIENDYDLYTTYLSSDLLKKEAGANPLKNLYNHWSKGRWDTNLAAKTMGRMVMDAAKKYAREFSDPNDWKFMFPRQLRDKIAMDFADNIKQQFESGELLPESVKHKKVLEMKSNYVKELRKLLESEIDQAEVVIAAKSMGDDLQGMIEKLSDTANKTLPAVVDEMGDQFGMDKASEFHTAMTSEMSQLLDAVKDTKMKVDQHVASLTGAEAMPMNDMSSDMDMGDDFDMGDDMGSDDIDLDMDDDFGGSNAEAGPEEEPLGRAMKD